ncbi:MAG: hypothetical protein AAGE65_13655 [Planctomycetota bacterium]
MTCIVAIKTKNRVLMMGDSLGGCLADYSVTMRRDPKVFRCGDLVIGHTTSFRMAQLVRFGLHSALDVSELKPPADPGDGLRFMVRDFVPRVRHVFDEGGFTQEHRGQERGGEMLVAWGAQLFGVQSDFNVQDFAEDFAAAGCGTPYALGALSATASEEPARRAVIALRAAAHFSAFVRAPFIGMETTGSELDPVAIGAAGSTAAPEPVGSNTP